MIGALLLPARDQGDVLRRARRARADGAAQDRASLRVVFGVNALALLVLGIFWNPIMAWCQQAFAGVESASRLAYVGLNRVAKEPRRL